VYPVLTDKNFNQNTVLSLKMSIRQSFVLATSNKVWVLHHTTTIFVLV